MSYLLSMITMNTVTLLVAWILAMRALLMTLLDLWMTVNLLHLQRGSVRRHAQILLSTTTCSQFFAKSGMNSLYTTLPNVIFEANCSSIPNIPSLLFRMLMFMVSNPMNCTIERFLFGCRHFFLEHQINSIVCAEVASQGMVCDT